MERATGIEPAYTAWKAVVLPLNYARFTSAINSQLAPCPQVAHYAENEGLQWVGTPARALGAGRRPQGASLEQLHLQATVGNRRRWLFERQAR